MTACPRDNFLSCKQGLTHSRTRALAHSPTHLPSHSITPLCSIRYNLLSGSAHAFRLSENNRGSCKISPDAAHQRTFGFREWDAYVYDQPTLKYAAAQRSCDLRLVGPTVFQTGFGLALAKNSPWTQKFSNALISYGERNIIHNLNKVWLSGKCGERDHYAIAHGFAAMTVEDMSGVFVGIVALGMGGATVALLIEFQVARRGFPLSRLWMNEPNWKAEPRFNKTSSLTSAGPAKLSVASLGVHSAVSEEA